MFLENGADPNTGVNSSWTCLHEAIRKNDIESIRLLLDYGAIIDPSMINLVQYYGYLEIVELFEAYETLNIKQPHEN